MWSVKPGDLVVCVKNGIWHYDDGAVSDQQIPYRTICTVRRVSKNKRWGFWPEIYLHLEGWDGRWFARRFRPVAKPSIENLRQLTTKPDLVKENA